MVAAPITGRRINVVSKMCCIKFAVCRFFCSRNDLTNQKTKYMRAAVSKVTDNNERARQNNRGITAHKTKLEITNDSREISHGPPQPIDEDSIDNAEIENLPQALARSRLNGVDNCRVVNLVDIVFLFKQPRHLS